LNCSPLHIATEGGYNKLVEMLLSYKANIEQTDSRKETPLHKAIKSRSEACVNLLINAGSNVNSEDSNGTTPLLLSETKRYYNISSILLKNKADPNCCDKLDNTILWSLCDGKPDFARMETFIREYKVDINQLIGRYKFSLLHRVLYQLKESQTLEIVKSLIALGAKIDLRNAEGKTPIYFAAYKSQIQTLSHLLSNGANPNDKDNVNNRPLHFASTTEVAKILINHGAKINAKNKQGYTPLHVAYAFRSSNTDLIAYLQNNGANIHSKNNNHMTPQQTLAPTVDKKLILSLLSSDHAFPEYGGIKIEFF